VDREFASSVLVPSVGASGGGQEVHGGWGASLGKYQKRSEVCLRDLDVIDSSAAFYRYNICLLGINDAALVASAASVVLEFFISRGNAGNNAKNAGEIKARFGSSSRRKGRRGDAAPVARARPVASLPSSGLASDREAGDALSLDEGEIEAVSEIEAALPAVLPESHVLEPVAEESDHDEKVKKEIHSSRHAIDNDEAGPQGSIRTGCRRTYFR
jgi:hypothetical protein